MRSIGYAFAAVALLMAVPRPELRASLSAGASVLFEAAPFAAAGVLLGSVFARRAPAALAFLGCGCGAGASARSIPAAVATAALFGPGVAIARWLAATVAGRLLGKGTHDRQAGLLLALEAMIPAAIVAAVAATLRARIDVQTAPVWASVAFGALLGIASAPCALGIVAIAASLRASAPVAAGAYLCLAGIAGIRWRRIACGAAPRHDGFAYLLLAIASFVVFARHGDALVHPLLAWALGACSAGTLALAAVHRGATSPPLRVAPALMLAAALCTAPAPTYRATETTVTDLFAGERLSFTGSLAIEGRRASVVRYAITCCRADAVPVAIALARIPALPTGTWVVADGVVEDDSRGRFVLAAQRVDRLEPPADPYVYR